MREAQVPVGLRCTIQLPRANKPPHVSWDVVTLWVLAPTSNNNSSLQQLQGATSALLSPQASAILLPLWEAKQSPCSAGLTGSSLSDGRSSTETSPEMWSSFRLWLCSGKVQIGSPQSCPQVYVKFFGFTSSRCCCYPKEMLKILSAVGICQNSPPPTSSPHMERSKCKRND